MERLSDAAIEIINELHTERLDYSSEYIPLIDAANRLAAYEDTGLEPEEIKVHEAAKYNAGYYHGDEDRCRWIEKELGPIDHLRDLLQAEQDGRLVVLPAKTVFELVWDAGPDCDLVCPVSIDGHGCCDFCDKGELCIYERKCLQEHIEQIGKTVFLTREEAEAALAQEGGTNEDSGSL